MHLCTCLKEDGLIFSPGAACGGAYHRCTVSPELNRIPVYFREGAVLAEGPAVQHAGELNTDNRIEKIRIFGMPDQSALKHEKSLSCTDGQAVIEGVSGAVCESFGVHVTAKDDSIVITAA